MQWKNKLKLPNNFELYLAFFLAIVVIILSSVSFGQNKTKNISQNQSYIEQMQNKIVTTIQSIDGCGNAKVSITCANQGETVYAYNQQSQTEKGVTTQTNTLVLVGGKPLVVEERYPKITGVVVVCEGGGDAVVKYKIIQTIVTLLDIDVESIQVFTYKN